MGKGGRSGRGSSSGSNMFGSTVGGLHLVGGAVGVNNCESSDTSFYCQLSRFSSSVSMILQLIMILAIIYFLVKYFLLKRK